MEAQPIEYYIEAAVQQHATIYGTGEYNCGDYDAKPRPCNKTAVTASGEQFNPHDLIAAVPLPRNRILRPVTIRILTYKGKCVNLRITDKKHERYIGKSGLDLTPAAVKAITGEEPSKYWGGKITMCSNIETLTETYTTEVIEMENFLI